MATPCDSPLLSAALRYAEQGYAVFPCRPGSKLPATGHGHNDATANAVQIRQWWSRQTDRNIGLACNGLLVIDIDPNGLSWPGDDVKRQSIKTTGCPLQRTPRGGFHLIFGIPAGHHWRCSVGQLTQGVDVRTGGGYVLAAPSVVKGKSYRWIRSLVPKSELPPPPDWLVEALDALERRRQCPSAAGGQRTGPGRGGLSATTHASRQEATTLRADRPDDGWTEGVGTRAGRAGTGTGAAIPCSRGRRRAEAMPPARIGRN